MLVYLDLRQFETEQLFSSQEIDDKPGWLDGYRDHLMQWQELIQVVKDAEEFMKFVGIYSDCHLDLKEKRLRIRFKKPWNRAQRKRS